MLLSQDLRWRHQRGLRPAFDRQQHRCNCDYSFTGANVALQQSIHWPLACQVASQFGNDAPLRLSESERQRGYKALEHFARPIVRSANTRSRRKSARTNYHLHFKEFSQNKLLTRDREALEIVGEMDRPQQINSQRRGERFWLTLTQDTPVHGWTGIGARQRRSPTGGLA